MGWQKLALNLSLFTLLFVHFDPWSFLGVTALAVTIDKKQCWQHWTCSSLTTSNIYARQPLR